MKTTQTIHTLVELVIEGFPSFVDTDNLEKVITKKCNLSWQLEFTEDDKGKLTLTPLIIEQPKIKVEYQILDPNDGFDPVIKYFEIDLGKLEQLQIAFSSLGGSLNRPNPTPVNSLNIKPKTLYVDIEEMIYWVLY